MKNIEIKEKNAEQRESYMLMSIKSWQSMLMEEVISRQYNQSIVDNFVTELRLRIGILNNMRVMRGKEPLSAYMISHNLT